MKKALSVAIAAAMTAATAHAFTQGNTDLYLGFQQANQNSGATHSSSLDYLVDIGPLSIYQNATSAFSLNTGLSALGGTNIGSIGTDLSSSGLFASTWATNVNTEVGVVGNLDDGSFTVLFSLAHGTATPPVLTNSKQSTIASAIGDPSFSSSLAGAFSSGTAAGNSPVAVTQSVAGGNNSWGSFVPPTGGTGSYTFLPDIQSNFGSGAAGAGLDLYYSVPHNPNPKPNAVLLGEFTFDSAGDVTFTPASIPEPSSPAIIGAGVAMLGCVRRRRA
jgi:hypothetical protein